MEVPFADLYRQYVSIQPEVDRVLREVIRASAFVRGPWVDRFESEFSELVGVPHTVSCANGTDALYIAMRALGVGPGDEVIVPAMSWIATSETVSQAGGTVIFCDLDPRTHTLDPDRFEAAITPRTVGVIPVHLYGQPAAMDRICSVAERRGLWVLEDSAQAHLARFGGRPVGSFGRAATFSFYPGKNLGAMGDAGAIVTGDAELAERMAMFSRHGGLTKHEHRIEGINSRLDGLQAAVLSVKMPYLPAWTERRRMLAERYREGLRGLPGLILPTEAPGAHHVWHLFVVLVEDRDSLAAALRADGVATAVNYPRALPFLPCYRDLGHRPEDFPAATRLQAQGLSLPLFAEMTDEELDYVVERISARLATPRES